MAIREFFQIDNGTALGGEWSKMIQIYCGEGKGKTTAAIGGAIRAAGAGYQVLFTQFMKGNNTGELSILANIPELVILRSKKDFGFFNQMTNKDKKELTDIHNYLIEEIDKVLTEAQLQNKSCFIVLDEITYAYNWEVVQKDKVCNLLAKKSHQVEFVITGREPAEELMEKADYISCITCKKHPFEQGIAARKGIEY